MNKRRIYRIHIRRSPQGELEAIEPAYSSYDRAVSVAKEMYHTLNAAELIVTAGYELMEEGYLWQKVRENQNATKSATGNGV